MKLFKTSLLFLLAATLGVSAFSAQIIDRTPDGKGLKARIFSYGDKYLLHVEGNGYEMGYQQGWLMAKEVKELCSMDFFRQLAMTFFGSDDTIKDIINDDFKFGVIYKACEVAAKAQAMYVPRELRDEIHGIAEGATARLNKDGDSTKVSYDSVLMNNIGFDLLMSFGYQFIVRQYLKDDPAAAAARKLRIMDKFHMCDGFVATKEITTTGGTLMGRNFMFTTLLSNRSFLIEYAPSEGNKMVAVTFPSYIGIPSIMNDKGLCIGMDMARGLATNPAFTGMGVILTARYVAQHQNSVPEALNTIKNIKVRGCPWIYILGDKNTGAVAEVGPTYTFNVTPVDKKFFAARYVDYVDDPENPAPDGITQGESNPYYVACSNHFITPTIAKWSQQYANESSRIRYDLLNKLVNEEAMKKISPQTAIKLVNYLSPLPDNPYKDRYFSNGTQVWQYYQTQPYVWGMRVMFDIKNMKVYALYNHWDDLWATYDWEAPLK
ncbi:MAG: hypothetical protein GY750_19235 [Lentisphaerae bacterium]|nr:hypothetical protein [Lentisphaerota bacterium]MCP4103532.1 hypothetical protein [Lentisphaerota bacterium]